MARIDLNGIKSEIKSILDGANTTTGSPIDLSDSLQTRVQKVVSINPELIPIQPSWFPCITSFFDSKSIDQETIAKDQLTGKRKAEIEIKVVGIVWRDDIQTANFNLNDLADNECELLMENIEQVLRKDPSLGGKVLWSYPTNVTFHNLHIDEGSHFRTGVLSLRAAVFY